MALSADKGWVWFDPMTWEYKTGDGTSVSAELVDSVCCLADVVQIAQIRANQRAAIKAAAAAKGE